MRTGQPDEAPRQLDALGAPVVVAPDHEELQRHDRRGRPHVLVQRGVLDRRTLALVEHVDGQNQPAAHMRRDRVEVVFLDQEARRVRRKLPRNRVLEPPYALVGRVVAVLPEHRPQRFALVHRDHREGPARAGDRVERRHSPFLRTTSAYQRPLSFTVRRWVS